MMHLNETIETLLAHRSIRQYTEDPIPEEIVAQLLEAGSRAATAGNLQLYSFLVVDDKDQMERLGLGGIHNLAQAIAARRFTDEATMERHVEIQANLTRAGFVVQDNSAQ